MQLKIKEALLNFVRPSEHSTFSPSASDQWISCPARIRLTKDIPQETSIYADEGTLAHSVCEAVFRENFYYVPFPQELNLKMAMTADYGAEMLMSANQYSDVVASYLNNPDEIGDVLFFGLEVGIPIYAEEGCFGTADCLVIGTRGCAIIDFKYGKGKAVAAESLQLKTYLVGVFKNLENIPENYNFISVVHQPRIVPAPKTITYKENQVKEHSDIIFEAIQRSKDVSLEPVEGSHCYWCPAKRTREPALKCPIMKEKPLKLAQENFSQFLKDMNLGPVEDELASTPKRDEAMLKLIALAPVIAHIAEECRDELKLRCERGEKIEGVFIGEKTGNRKLNFENDDEAIKAIEAEFKIDPTVTVKKIKTLGQLDKELGKGKIDKFCIKPIKKELKILDEKSRELLKSMQVYSALITEND